MKANTMVSIGAGVFAIGASVVGASMWLADVSSAVEVLGSDLDVVRIASADKRLEAQRQLGVLDSRLERLYIRLGEAQYRLDQDPGDEDIIGIIARTKSTIIATEADYAATLEESKGN